MGFRRAENAGANDDRGVVASRPHPWFKLNLPEGGERDARSETNARHPGPPLEHEDQSSRTHDHSD